MTRVALLCCTTVAMLSGLAGVVSPARAQVTIGMRAQDVGINAAIGVVIATAWSVVRGRGFSGGLHEGAGHGLVGGAVMAAGRQIAASPFAGSGFAGREVSAVGISLITSAGRDHVTLSFPVGPVAFQVVDGRSFDWRINAVNAIAAVVNSVSATDRIDAGLSLSSGTLVFRGDRRTFHTSSGEATGSEAFASIKLAQDAFDGSGVVPRALFHENVHVLQDDFLTTAVTNPIERAAIERSSLGRRISRHVDIGLLSVIVTGTVNGVVPYAARPWEREAYALTPMHNY